MCPACVNKPHTIGHMLQICRRTHGPRIHRHNKIAESIRKKLKDTKYEVLWEAHIRTTAGILKPDLISWSTPSVKVYVLDVAYNAKKTKYSTPEVISYAKEVSGELVEVEGIVSNWRGAISGNSVARCKPLIDKIDIAVISLRVLQDGLYLYDLWQKTTTRVHLVDHVDW